MKILSELKERAAMRRLTGAILATAVFGCAMGSVYAAEETTAAAEEKVAAAAEEPIDEYTLSETVVTAERIPTERMETPANISVITDKDIAANHYVDISEALSQVNGVTISHQGSFDGIALNGDERVVVMVDGRRLNNDQGLATGEGRVDLKMIPTLKNIARIEILKGGASALYGSDAVGGVVNIITKRGSKKPETTLDVNMGSWGTYNYEVATQGSDNDFSWFVSGGIQKQNHVRYKMHGESANAPKSDKDDNSFALRLDQNLDKSSSVRLNFEHKTKHDGTYYNAVNKGTGDKKREELFNNFAVSYQFKEDKKTPGYVRFFNNYRSTVYGTSNFNTRLFGIDYQNGWEFGEHTVVAGAEWHESRSANAGSGYEGEKLRDIAAYVQDTWKIGDKWSLVPGVRFDNQNLYGSHWSPKVAVNYRANKKTQLYASWGRVFQAPKADDLFTYLVGPGWGTIGNKDLKPETGHTETIGFNYQVDDDTRIGFSVFQSQLHDAIDWGMRPDGIWTAVNVNKEKRRGLELTFNRRISLLWDIDLGYSYTSIQKSDANGDLGYYANNKNPNSYHIGLKYHQGPWKAGLYGNFKSGIDETNFLSRHVALVDLNVSYDVNDATTIYFKALNLFNQEYSEYQGNYGKYYPGNCRFFQLGITYTF